MTTTMTIYKEDTDNFNNNIDTGNEKNDNNKNSSRLMKMRTWD